MLIPGWIIGVLTFPGIIVHEFAHKFFCEINKIRVHEVNWFSIKGGHVIHDPPDTYSAAFLITIGPLIINTFFAFVILWITNIIPNAAINVFLLWVGISIGMHAFPSNQDVDILWKYSKAAWKNNLIALVGFPLTILVKIANVLSVVWFDLFFAMGILLLATGSLDVISQTQLELNDFSSITSNSEYVYCLEKKGQDYCDLKLYDWCMGEFNDSSHCASFKSCLGARRSYDYCDSEYFTTTYR